MTFVEAAKVAKVQVADGIQALEAPHRLMVQCAKGIKFSGSVNLDEAYRMAEPQSNRWDYGLGFKMANTEYAVWIEPHSATSTHEITTMLRKLMWLKGKLASDEFAQLYGLTQKTRNARMRQFWWVTSGKISIRPGTTAAVKLAKGGLNFPCRRVTVGSH